MLCHIYSSVRLSNFRTSSRHIFFLLFELILLVATGAYTHPICAHAHTQTHSVGLVVDNAAEKHIFNI